MRKISTVKKYVYQFFKHHQAFLEVSYPGINASILLKRYIEWSSLEPEQRFLNPNHLFFRKALEGVPFEYLLQNKFFYNHNFFVSPDVLIPRNETEILVEDAVKYVQKHYHSDFNMIEVGVGSGCIFLSVLAEVHAAINCTAIDIDQAALNVSKKNFFRLQNSIHPQTKVSFIQQDRFSNLKGSYDLILSNPPYIKQFDGQSGVHPQVLNFEPHLALFLDDEDYRSWFNIFFAQGSALLKDSGMLMMEGHEDTLEELKVIAQDYFSNCELKRDYTHALRFLHLRK